MLRALFFLFISFTAIAQPDVLNIEKDDALYLGPIIGFVEDQDEEFNCSDIQNKLISGELESNFKKVFSERAQKGKTWFAFRARNLTSEKIWLHLAKSSIDYLDVYKVGTNGELIQKFELGSLRGRDKNIIDAYTFYIPLLDYNNDSIYDIIVSCKTGTIREIPMIIGSYQKLDEEFAPFSLITKLFLGGMLLILLYSFVLFLITWDRSYVYYCGYVFSVTLATTFVSNFPIAEELLGAYIVNTYPSLIFCLGLLLIAAVTVRLLQMEKTLPIYRWILVILCVIRLMLGGANLFVEQVYLTLPVQVVSLMAFIACLVPTYILAFKKNSIALILSIGWTSMLLGAVGHILTSRGLLEYSYLTRSLFQISVWVEVLIFSVVLARRINTLKSEQESLNEELENKNYSLVSLNDSLDTFNYHVSHDLKTVLVHTKSMGKMIQKYSKKKDHEKLEQITDKLMQVAESGEETVQSFLELARVNNLTNSEIVEYILIEEEVDKIIELNGLRDKIDFKFIGTGEMGMSLHQKAFESLMLNFLTNSIKYCDGHPKATLKFFNLKETYVLIYEDNGIGIDMEKDGEKLFMPFVRIKNDLNQEGSGVGLFIVRRMLENYNGTIEASSELGEGISFKVTIRKNSVQ